MATSSDQTTDVDIAAPSGVKTAAANTETHEGEIHSQENTLDFDHSPVMSKESKLKVEKPKGTQEQVAIESSTDTKTTTLSSLFPSPRLVTDDSKSIASFEDGEIVEAKSDNAAGASHTTVQEQNEQINETAESKFASCVVNKEDFVASPPERRVEATKTDVDIETEDSDFKTDTDASIVAPKPSRPAHSLPPHMRPDFQSPPSRLFGLQDPRHVMLPNEATRFNDSPRAPRAHYSSYGSRGGDHGDREQVVRMNAQLMKLKNELDAERTKNIRLRKAVEAEQQQKVEAASSVMLTNLLREQAAALTLKSKVEARERDLDYREQKITQLEVYLSEGQKQLMYDLEKNGDRPMSAVQMEHARREAELNAQKAMADMNGKLNIKMEALRIREGAQQMREQHWKAMAREQLEVEFAENSITHEKADEVAEEAYSDGFGAGKEAGRKEALKESHQRGFLEGYGACHRTQIMLSKVRQGLIARDDPDLDFLYDASHPHNLWNIGEMVGRLQRDDKIALTKEDVKKETSNEKKTSTPVQEHNGPEETSRMNGKVDDQVDGRMNGHINDHTSSNTSAHIITTNGNTNGTVIHKREEPVTRMLPLHPTFAAELRGPSLTHNGHVVLANNTASHVVKEIGRPIIKYEEEGVNLIDLM